MLVVEYHSTTKSAFLLMCSRPSGLLFVITCMVTFPHQIFTSSILGKVHFNNLMFLLIEWEDENSSDIRQLSQ